MLVYILIAIVILVIIVLLIFSGHPAYAPLSGDGFQGVPISQLAQLSTFYAGAHDATLKYLQAVYPAAKDTLAALSVLELASFYNSLWFYYNCKGELIVNGVITDALACAAAYPLPYTPQGRIYNFESYNKYNVPEINSDSNSSIENALSQGSANGRFGGIPFLPGHSIQRDVWWPKGLQNEKPLSENTPDNWKVHLEVQPFGYPNGWYGHLGDGQYIEVSHTPANVGDLFNMSPFWWYNVVVGSGMFLYLGKTLAVKNKISGVFTQAQMLADTSHGQELLQKWYNTIDPYEIVWGIMGLCGFNSVTGQKYCDFAYQACGAPFACQPTPIGFATQAKYPLYNFYIETLRYQHDVLKDPSNIPSQNAIHQAIDLARENQHYSLGHVAEQYLGDETNFFFGINLGLDTIQFYEDPSPNDNYVFELIDLRIPQSALAAAKNRDYSGFMNVYQPNAVPILSGASWVDPMAAPHNLYKQSAIDNYLKNAYDNNWISIRDPLDVYNNSKVIKCDGLAVSNVCPGNKPASAMYCNTPFLDTWKCL